MVNYIELEAIRPSGRYSPTEAARLLDVTRTTIYRAMKEGQIKFTECQGKKARKIKGIEITKYFNTH